MKGPALFLARVEQRFARTNFFYRDRSASRSADDDESGRR
jgi:hypothetical protein